MKTYYYFLVGLLFTCNSVCCQNDSIATISFEYDQAGNRIKRDIVYYEGSKKSTSEILDDDELIEEELRVYPNPVAGKLHVDLTSEILKSTNKRLLLFDGLGRPVYESVQVNLKNDIEFDGLNSGTYILKLIYGNKQKQWIIIKN